MALERLRLFSKERWRHETEDQAGCFDSGGATTWQHLGVLDQNELLTRKTRQFWRMGSLCPNSLGQRGSSKGFAAFDRSSSCWARKSTQKRELAFIDEIQTLVLMRPTRSCKQERSRGAVANGSLLHQSSSLIVLLVFRAMRDALYIYIYLLMKCSSEREVL